MSGPNTCHAKPPTAAAAAAAAAANALKDLLRAGHAHAFVVHATFQPFGAVDGEYERELLAQATAAAREPESTVKVARYLACLAGPTYRYGSEDSVSCKAAVWTLYHFSGALYMKVEECELAWSLRSAVVDALDHAIVSRCTTLTSSAQTDDAAKSALARDSTYIQLRALLRHIDTSAWAHVWQSVLGMLRSACHRRCSTSPSSAAFTAALDADPALLGFQNGVYSLSEMRFYAAGAAFPRDRFAVSMSTGYSFLHEPHPDVLNRARELLYGGLCANADNQCNAQRFTGAMLHGGHGDTAKLFIFANAGDVAFNSGRQHRFRKTVAAVLGDYADTLDAGQITASGRRPDATNSGLAACRHKRVCFVQHAAGSLTVSDSAVTTLCVDEQRFRDLWSKSKSGIFQPKLVVVAQELPTSVRASAAALDRLLPVLFSDATPPPAAEEDLRPYFMHLFLEQFAEFRRSDRRFPLPHSIEQQLRGRSAGIGAPSQEVTAAFSDYIEQVWEPTTDADFNRLGRSVVTCLAEVLDDFEKSTGHRLGPTAAKTTLRMLGFDAPDSRVRRRGLKLPGAGDDHHLNVHNAAWLTRKRLRDEASGAETTSCERGVSDCASVE